MGPDTAAMALRVLGPVEVEVEGRPVGLPRRHERCLLGVLLLDVNRVISPGRLASLIWDGEPPEGARRTLQSHVSRIRARLTAAGTDRYGVELVSAGGGYRLHADPELVDAHRFRALLDEAAAAGDPTDRAERLRAGLDLWRGPALDGAASDWLRSRLCADLEELRLTAVEDLMATSLELGRAREVLAELAGLSSAHPDRERLVALHMRVLIQAGRRVDALAVFERTRAHLAEELGLDPGRELRALHQAILRDEPLAEPSPTGPAPAAVDAATSTAARRPAEILAVPRQLPPDVTAFTGRQEQLRQLGDLLAEAGDGTAAVAIVVIDGTAGVGKSALARHWAHQVTDRFADGQLYADLRGDAAAPPAEVLARFLHALGVPPDQVPASIDEAAALYRSLLSGKRVLVLLDDAAHSAQVRPLLPGGGGSLVLVTSRERLAGLTARDGALRLRLDVLTAAEADALLIRMLGAERAGAEHGAAAELAALCGYLPLALRIAAANLVSRPNLRLRSYAIQLRGRDRLDALAVPGDAAVAATFDQSYTRLPDAARRLFRLLGLAPGPDITAEGAAALAGIPLAQAGRLLEDLAGRHLVEEGDAGRYALHDLLRRYAATRCEEEENGAERAAATRRLYRSLLRGADAAARLLYPEKARLPVPDDLAGDDVVAPDGHAHALAWLDAERARLVAAVVQAADDGHHELAWLIADTLRGYFWLCREAVGWTSMAKAALAAADAGGDPRAAVAARLMLADAYLVRGRPALAIAEYEHAASAGRALGAFEPAAHAALNNLGTLHLKAGRLRQAADLFQEVLEYARRGGTRVAQALALGNLGCVHQAMGHLQHAAYLHTRALVVLGDLDVLGLQAAELSERAAARHALGQFGSAAGDLRQALLLHRRVGDNAHEAETRGRLAAVYRDTDVPALHLARSAVTLAHQTGERHIEAATLNTLASVHLRHGQLEQAADHYRRALAVTAESESAQPHAEALIGMAAAHLRAADHAAASENLTRALASVREAGYAVLEGQALTVLSALHLAEGDPVEAAAVGAQALALHLDTGHKLGAARSHLLLGQALHGGGKPCAAREHLSRAHDIFGDLGIPEVGEVTRLLHDLRDGPGR